MAARKTAGGTAARNASTVPVGRPAEGADRNQRARRGDRRRAAPGRPTLVCGPAGCGKTLLAMEFLVRGASRSSASPACSWRSRRRPRNCRRTSRRSGSTSTSSMRERSSRSTTCASSGARSRRPASTTSKGCSSASATRSTPIGAKRVVLDTIETLFAAFSTTAILRAELRRLFRWLKDGGSPRSSPASAGDGTLTRHGIEEYVSDCVIVLDHRVTEQIATRRLRILKYRGSHHGTNEYPFLIGETGVSVLPITSLGLEHDASSERLSTGVARLDAMLGGRGYSAAARILVSGTRGHGQVQRRPPVLRRRLPARRARAVLRLRGIRGQIVRNMRSIGMDLEQWVDQGLLRFQCVRPEPLGLEAHLSSMQAGRGVRALGRRDGPDHRTLAAGASRTSRPCSPGRSTS